jgi:hypothetical protein
MYYIVLCYKGFVIVDSNSRWLCYLTQNLYYVTCIKSVANYNALNRFIRCIYTGCIYNAWTNFKGEFFESKKRVAV